MCRRRLSSPRCRSELIDSAWVVIVPGQKCIKEILKASLENATLLHHPDFTKSFVLTTDDSNKAIGFALMQERDGKLVPIIFGVRVLTDPEKRYSTADKELLGVYFAVKKYEYYLIGHQYFVYTDHKPLIYLKAFKDIVNKRYRWIEYSESVNTVIRYIPGAEHY